MNKEKFRELKEREQNALLLFRSGDYYETYEEDAVTASEILGITLTTTDGVKSAGFPYHALDSYLPKIVRAGKRVGIIDGDVLVEKVQPQEEEKAEEEEEATQPIPAAEEPDDDSDSDEEEEEEETAEEPERILAKVETSSRELLSKLSVLEKALPRQASMPICETIRLSLENRVCRLSTADTEGIYTNAVLRAAYSGEDCATCIPAKGLAKVVRTLNGQNLELEIHTYHVVLKYVGGQIELGTKSAKEFPAFPDATEIAGETLRIHDVTKDWFRAAVKRALPNMSTDAIRPVMNGVRVNVTEGRMDVVATDGRRLVLTKKEYAGSKLEGTLSKACAEMYLAMADQVTEIQFGKYITLHCSDYDMLFKQPADPEVRYPNYINVIPTDCDKVVNVAKSDLVSVLNRIVTFADGAKAASIRVEMSSMELRSYVTEMFEAQIRDRIFVNSEISEAFIFDLSSEMLLGLLSDIDCDKINMKIAAPNRPILLAGDGEEDNITRLLMPIATTGEAYKD